MRLVVDTNTLVSAALRPNGEAGRLLNHLRRGDFVLLYSAATWKELVEVLNRPQLRHKYHLTDFYLHFFLRLIQVRAEQVVPNEPIAACRDANDNKFLEVAVSGAANYLISNDGDLLILSPFAGVRIITSREALERLT